MGKFGLFSRALTGRHGDVVSLRSMADFVKRTAIEGGGSDPASEQPKIQPRYVLEGTTVEYGRVRTAVGDTAAWPDTVLCSDDATLYIQC